MNEFKFDQERCMKEWGKHLDAWMLEGVPLPSLAQFIAQQFAAQFVDHCLAQDGILAA